MKDIRSLLTEADPLRREPGLSEGEASRMRSVVVDSAKSAAAAPILWSQAFAVAAVVVLMVIAGFVVGRRLPGVEQVPNSQLSDHVPVSGDGGERRQLQFATPGGTRIIWTLDPDFQLKGVVP